MTQPYGGPERRADVVGVAKLRESVTELSGRVAGMTVALEETTAVSAAAHVEAADVRALAERTRRYALLFSLLSALMLVGLTVALVLSFVGLHREHQDFVELRNQSVGSCQLRNAQAANNIEFYRSLGAILVGASKRNPSPELDDAIKAFQKASDTVPPQVDCAKVAKAGNH